MLHASELSAGNDKFDARWKLGVCLGVCVESDKSLVGTDEVVDKARDFRRTAENGGSWSVTDFGKVVGVP